MTIADTISRHVPSHETYQEKYPQEADIRIIIPPNIGFQKERESDAPQRLKNIALIEDKGKKAWARSNRLWKTIPC